MSNPILELYAKKNAPTQNKTTPALEDQRSSADRSNPILELYARRHVPALVDTETPYVDDASYKPAVPGASVSPPAMPSDAGLPHDFWTPSDPGQMPDIDSWVEETRNNNRFKNNQNKQRRVDFYNSLREIPVLPADYTPAAGNSSEEANPAKSGETGQSNAQMAAIQNIASGAAFGKGRQEQPPVMQINTSPDSFDWKEGVDSFWKQRLGDDVMRDVSRVANYAISEELRQLAQEREAVFNEYIEKSGVGEKQPDLAVGLLPRAEDGSLTIGQIKYSPEEVEQYVSAYVADKKHSQLFEENADYRNEWLLSHTGMTEKKYRNTVADDLEKQIEKIKKNIPQTPILPYRNPYADLGAAMSGQENYNAGAHDSSAGAARGWVDKAMLAANTLRNNNFVAGFKEGSDLKNILTLGFKGTAENVNLVNALNAASRGEKLSQSQQSMVDAWSVQQQIEDAIATLGGRSVAASIGESGAQSLEFVTQMMATGGIASAATKGISTAAARVALRGAMTKGAGKVVAGLQRGSLKLAESVVGAAARTPFMGATYQNYTDKRLSQFTSKEIKDVGGEVRRIIEKAPTSAWRDAGFALLETGMENHSEDIGVLFGAGFNAAGRRLATSMFGKRVGLKSLTGFKRNAALTWVGREAKITNFAGEVFGEAYGDAMVNLFEGNKDGWRQMLSKDYWWTLGGVSLMLSGSFGALNAPGAISNARNISSLEGLKRKSLSSIENNVLKSHLVSATNIDNITERSNALKSIDWKDKSISKEDAVHAMDYINTQTMVDIKQGTQSETERLMRFLPMMETIANAGYKGVDGKQSPEEIIRVASKDGVVYCVLSGNIEGPGNIEVMNAAGQKQMIESSSIVAAKHEDISDVIAQKYATTFKIQANQEQLDKIRTRVLDATQAGVDAKTINNIIQDAGLKIYAPGDEVATSDGQTVTVNKVLGGAYEVVNESGITEEYGFNDILQPDQEMAQAQKSEGVIAETPATPEQQVKQQLMGVAEEQIAQTKNQDDDVIYTATLKGKEGSKVNIIKGTKLVYNPETGEIDKQQSDMTVAVRYANGTKGIVSINDIDMIVEAVGVDEVRTMADEAIQAQFDNAEQQRALDVPMELGSVIELKNGRIGVVDGVNEDGTYNIVTQNDQGQIVTEQIAGEDIARVVRDDMSDSTPERSKFEDVEPVGIGPFGEIYDQFEGHPDEAIAFLREKQSGEVLGALHHQDVGSIDLVWGYPGSGKSDGFGLSKLVKYHPEVVADLQNIVSDMHIVGRTDNRIQLESDTHRASIRLDWDSKKKTWLLTAFEKEKISEPGNRTTDVVADRVSDLSNDTAPRQGSDISTSKNTTNIPNSQTLGAKDQFLGRSLTEEKATQVLLQMQDRAVPAPRLELTPENWTAEFGEDGVVSTPIGEVKIGENQYLKLLKNDRGSQFGMVRPTLADPNVIIEEVSQSTDGSTERPSSLVFVKTFLKPDGQAVRYFTSVTVSRNGMEVVVSNHLKEKNRINSLLKNGKLQYRIYGGPQSEQVQLPISATTSLTDAGVTNKDTTTIPESQAVEMKIPRLKNGLPNWNAMPSEQLAQVYADQNGYDVAVEDLTASRNANVKNLQSLERQLGKEGDLNKRGALREKIRALQAEDQRLGGALDLLGAESKEITPQQRISNAGRVEQLFPDGLPNTYMQTLADIARGQRFVWSDSPDGTKWGVARELGFVGNQGERRQMIGIVSSPEKGGAYLSTYIDDLRMANEGYDRGLDDNDIRNGVIEALQDAPSAGIAMKRMEEIAGRNSEDISAPRDAEDLAAMQSYEEGRKSLRQNENNGIFAENTPETYETAEKSERDNDEPAVASGNDGSRLVGDATGRVAGIGDRSDIRVFEEGLAASYREHSDGSERDRREAESERLVAVAKENGLYIDEKQLSQFGDKQPGKTGESVVYVNRLNGKVYKSKNPYAKAAIKGNAPEDAIYEHLIHNLLFPETRYTFQGISDHLGNVRIVLSQNFIESVGQPIKGQIDAALAARGLLPEDKYRYGNDLVSVADVEGDNVLTGNDGRLYFIDPIIRLKKPAREVIDELSAAQREADGGSEPEIGLDDVPFSVIGEASAAPAGVTPERWKVIVDQLRRVIGAENVVTDPAAVRAAYDDIMQRSVEVRRQQVAETNERFNEQLEQQIEGELTEAHVFQLGTPSSILLSAGIPNLPIELASRRLMDKSMQENHRFNLSEIKNLVEAIQSPLAVFRSATHIGSNVILTELKHGDKNFVAAIRTNEQRGKLKVNSVRSIHPRVTTNIADWIDSGLMDYCDSNRLLEWLGEKKKSRSYLNSSKPADVRKQLDSATNIVTNFENPKIEPENIRRSILTHNATVNNLQIELVNEQFNEQLEQLTTENANETILDLGMPSPEMLAAGVPNNPLRLYGNKLLKKAHRHGYDISDLENLPQDIEHPIAIFKGRYAGSHVLLTEIDINGDKAVVAIDINKNSDVSLNLVTSVYGKSAEGICSWIIGAKLLYVGDKGKTLEIASSSALNAGRSSSQGFVTATNIVTNFENPKIEPENIRRSIVSDNTLVGVHNLTEDNILHAVRIGGLANPSLAVIDTGKAREFDKFGDITLVAPRSLVGKRSGNNAGTFGADIFSPRYPRVENEYGPKLEKLTEKLDEFVRAKFDGNSPVAKRYARSKTYLNPANASNAERSLKREPFMQAYYVENALGKEIPHNATAEKIGEAIPNQADYFDWVNGLFRDAAEREVIFDGYTPSGRSHYVEHTLDNVSRLMKQQGRVGGEGYNYGMASLRSHFAPKFTTLEQIHKAKNRLEGPEEFEQTKKSFEREYEAIKQALIESNTQKDLSAHIDKHLEAAFVDGDLLPELEKFGYRPSEELLTRIGAFRASLEQMPAEYFETKFERPVQLKEFAGAVVPSDVAPETIAALNDDGVRNIETYDPAKPGDRARALKALGDKLHENSGVYFMQTPKGEVYGFATGGKIYLDSTHMNANTPMHEYVEFWSQIVSREQPELWARGVELMKQTEVWKQVNKDPNYKHLSEDTRASETLSRITARRFESKQAEIASDHKLMGKLRKWMRDFWNTLKQTFSKWTKQDLDKLTADDFAKMPMRDFVEGIDLTKYNQSKNTDPRFARDMVERKITTLERLENKRAGLIADKDNISNFEEQLSAVETEIEAYRQSDHVADTFGKDGEDALSDAHLRAVEDAVYDIVRHEGVEGVQVDVVQSPEALLEYARSNNWTKEDIEDIEQGILNPGYYGDGAITILSSLIVNKKDATTKFWHEWTHGVTDEVCTSERLTQAAGQAGSKLLNAALSKRGYVTEKYSMERMADEYVSRAIEILAKKGLLNDYLATPEADFEPIWSYLAERNVPDMLRDCIADDCKYIKNQKYGTEEKFLLRTGDTGRSATITGDQALRDRYNRTAVGTDEGPDGGGDVALRRGFSGAERPSERERDEGGVRAADAIGVHPTRGGDLASASAPKLTKQQKLITDLRRAVRESKASTRAVAQLVSRRVRESVGRELVEAMGKRDFDRLVRQIEQATARQDVEKPLQRIAEIVCDLEIKSQQDTIDKFLKLKVQGESPRGVSVAKSVDDQTRQAFELFRENIGRPIEEVRVEMEDRGLNDLFAQIDGMNLLEAYNDTQQSRRDVANIDREAEEIQTQNTELRRQRIAANKADDKVCFEALKTKIARNSELLDVLNEERVQVKEQLLKRLESVASNLSGLIEQGREIHNDWIKQRVDRRRGLIATAFRDVGDGNTIPVLDKQPGVWTRGYRTTRDFLLAPAYSMDYLLKMISKNAPKGEGGTYNHFMRGENGYVEARGKYYLGYEDFKHQLDEKSRSVFGKSYSEVLSDSNAPTQAVMTITDGKVKEEYTPTIGEALYIYMANKMTDGQVKLRRMDIDAGQVMMLADTLPVQYVRFADWLQDEFLPERRKVYNQTHLDVFGTQLAQIENYVPLKVAKSHVRQEVNGAKSDPATLPSAITGSIIKRKRNNLVLDLHTNALDLMLGHGQQMEHWNAYTRIVQDMNALLSSTAFRRMINARNPKLHGRLESAAKLAADGYRPETDDVNKAWVAISKFAASSKIAFRINTAVKQVLSYPAFYAYSADPKFWWLVTKNLSPTTWGKNWRWAIENVPSFRERWMGRMAGDEKLAQMTAPKLDKWIASMNKYGMYSNALVDAMTCASGAKAVYDFKRGVYLKRGKSDAEAERLARIDAAVAINETQQSSEGAYLSPMQANRDFWSVSLSTFQNSNFAYLRKQLEGIDELFRDVNRERHNRASYYKEQGMSEEAAFDQALKDVVAAKKEAVLNILVFTFVMNMLWSLGNNIWKYLFAEDSREEIPAELRKSALVATIRNTSIGSIAESISNGYDANPSVLSSDMITFTRKSRRVAEKEIPDAWNQTAAYLALQTLTANGVGIDLESFVNIYQGFAGMIRDGCDVEDIMLVLNAPRSQARLIAGKPKVGETAEQYQKRMIFIERKIAERVTGVQRKKWERNYTAYNQAELLGIPTMRDNYGVVSIPELKALDAEYETARKDLEMNIAGEPTKDLKWADLTPKQQEQWRELSQKAWEARDLEKEIGKSIIFNDAYKNQLERLVELKREYVEMWNKNKR